MKKITRLLSAVAKGLAWTYTVLAAGSIFFPRMTGGSRWHMVLVLGLWAIFFWIIKWGLSKFGKTLRSRGTQLAPRTAPQPSPTPSPAPASPARGHQGNKKKGKKHHKRATP